jgi:hypothetical protein
VIDVAEDVAGALASAVAVVEPAVLVAPDVGNPVPSPALGAPAADVAGAGASAWLDAEVLAAPAGDAEDTGSALELLLPVLTLIGALELVVATTVEVPVPPRPAVAAALLVLVATPRLTSLLARAVGPPLGHAWPLGCWLSRLLISASIREPAPDGPGG